MFMLNCKGRLLSISQPIVMGIINVTPDSFYAGSRQQTIDTILLQAEKMLEEGATILDIGGQSTRPGSSRISPEEELERVIEPILQLKNGFPNAYFSIDTYYGSVAREAVQAGADIVNDISAGQLDETMIPTVAELKVPYVLMHMQGTPDTMALKPTYTNVTAEVLDFFSNTIARLRDEGIQDIIVDPGFGFGKSIDHNFQLLQQLNIFKTLACPILVGLSRKSTVYKTLGVTAADALNGTTVLNTVALLRGASILRVHDVKEAMQAITLTQSAK
jgi:dihydropteroate synthase